MDFEQDVFKSGAFYYENQKNTLTKKLIRKEFNQKKYQKKIKIYKLVLELKKVDLELQQLNYLLSNILFKINQKENSDLLIEKYELNNSIEDLNMAKNSYLNDLKVLSPKRYEEIFVVNLNIQNLEEATHLHNTKKINLKIFMLDEKIKNTEFLPKLSFYSQAGYKFNEFENSKYDYSDEKEDYYYEYGFYLSIPFSFNKNNENKLASLKHLEKVRTQEMKKENKKQEYIKIKKDINSLNKKINNYNKIYTLKTKSYANNKSEYIQIISNKLKYEKLHIDILNIEKQLVFYNFIDS